VYGYRHVVYTRQALPHGLHFEAVTYDGPHVGARLIVVGGVHGNERCGTSAIHRVTAEIERHGIARGSVTFVAVANPLARAKGTRAGDRNLNRSLGTRSSPTAFEDHVANHLCPLLARHDVLLDLHSARSVTTPFAMVGPMNNEGTLEPFARAAEERALARRLGVGRFVDGWLSTYARAAERESGIGTTEYMRAQGGIAITLECGQHDDPEAAEVAYRAILASLAHLGLTAEPSPPQTSEIEYLGLYDVVVREHEDDTLARTWCSFDPITKDDLLATRSDGARVVAEEDGVVLFPDPAAPAGSPWFYVARTMPGELFG
jgi:predicted deacylase